MSDHIDKTIQDFRSKLEHAESEVIRLKRTINDLCELGQKPKLYTDEDLKIAPQGKIASFSNDAFYGKPLSTCIKHILEARKLANQGAATVDELYTVLVQHGYHFDGKEENRKTILRTMLRKNVDFHRLPHGGYGLRDWYEKIKSSADSSKSGDSDDDDSQADAPKAKKEEEES